MEKISLNLYTNAWSCQKYVCSYGDKNAELVMPSWICQNNMGPYGDKYAKVGYGNINLS